MANCKQQYECYLAKQVHENRPEEPMPNRKVHHNHLECSLLHLHTWYYDNLHMKTHRYILRRSGGVWRIRLDLFAANLSNVSSYRLFVFFSIRTLDNIDEELGFNSWFVIQEFHWNYKLQVCFLAYHYGLVKKPNLQAIIMNSSYSKQFKCRKYNKPLLQVPIPSRWYLFYWQHK